MSDARDQPDDDEPPVSVAVRVFLGVSAFLLVGGLIVSVILLRTLVPTVGTDLGQASDRLDHLVSCQLPEGFLPISTIDWNMLYVVPMTGVWIEAEDGDSVITIVRLEGRMTESADVRERAVEALRDQAVGSGEVEKTEPLEVVVGGLARRLNVRVVRQGSQGRVRVVSYDFDTPRGPILVEFKRPETSFTADEAIAFFQSLGPPGQ